MVSVYDFLQEWRRRGSVFFLFHKLHSCYGFSGFRINFHFDFWFIALRPNWSAIYSEGKGRDGWTHSTAHCILNESSGKSVEFKLWNAYVLFHGVHEPSLKRSINSENFLAIYKQRRLSKVTKNTRHSMKLIEFGGWNFTEMN